MPDARPTGNEAAPHDLAIIDGESVGYAAARTAAGLGLHGSHRQWNTGYLERETRALKRCNSASNESLLRYLSPLGWEHINLTDDHVWRQHRTRVPGKLRPLQLLPQPWCTIFSVF